MHSGSSTLVPNLKNGIEEGRQQFIEGEYEAAIQLLEKAHADLIGNTALLATNQNLQQLLRKAALFLAHSCLRLGNREKAIQWIQSVIRTHPDFAPPPADYGPELVQFFTDVHQQMKNTRSHSLSVVTGKPGCLIFVNERFVGLSPARIDNLYPGPYRVFVQHPNERGRVHNLDLSHSKHTLNVNTDLDQALETHPYVGFLFKNQETLEKDEVRFAISVGRALDANRIVLFGTKRHQGHLSLFARVFSVNTGTAFRAGLLQMEPTAPSPTTIKAFGQFLLTGKEAPGFVVQQIAKEKNLKNSFFSAKVFRWISMGVAVAAVGTSIPLFALHGQGTCNAPENIRCPEQYNTLGAGLGLAIGGGLSAAASAVLFYSSDSPDIPTVPSANTLSFYPWIGQKDAGFFAQISF
ncbi:MAG: tetratricopeptide repeat protein [Pseudomonadota bacterium]